MSQQSSNNFETGRSFAKFYLEGGGYPDWIKKQYEEHFPDEWEMLLSTSGLTDTSGGRFSNRLTPVRGMVRLVDWKDAFMVAGSQTPSFLKKQLIEDKLTPANLGETLLYAALSFHSDTNQRIATTLSLGEDFPVIASLCKRLAPEIFIPVCELVQSDFKLLVVEEEKTAKK